MVDGHWQNPVYHFNLLRAAAHKTILFSHQLPDRHFTPENFRDKHTDENRGFFLWPYNQSNAPGQNVITYTSLDSRENY
jgi:hypothetical protein